MGEAARYLQTMNSRYGARLEPIPRAEWTSAPMQGTRCPILEAWRSRHFLVMIFQDRAHERISVVRTDLADERSMRFKDGISWDDLQRLKRECGRGARWAVEVFPPDDAMVNVQNMRHLFLLPDAPAYGWRVRGGGQP